MCNGWLQGSAILRAYVQQMSLVFAVISVGILAGQTIHKGTMACDPFICSCMGFEHAGLPVIHLFL